MAALVREPGASALDLATMSASTHPTTLQLAIQHHQAGRLADAETLYREILARDPACVDALHYLGVIGLQTNHPAIALDLIGRAAALAPHHASVHSNLGEACRQLARFEEAVGHFRTALRLKPDHADALNNLGLALGSLGKPEEAIASFRHALRLKPDFAEAHNNLGNALKDQGHLDEALGCFRAALQFRPASADAHSNLGNLHKERGEIDEALACYRRAVELQPERADIHSNLVFTLHFAAGDNRAAIETELERWNRAHAGPLTREILPHVNDRAPGRRLRIGYVSGDFRAHPVGLNLLPLFRHHDHARCEIFCYSDVTTPDEVTAELKAGADHWRETAAQNHAQLAASIRSDRIDVLVDLALHTAGNRLPAFARKPAPVQLSFAGYPGRTGLDAIDHHLSDPHLEPSPPISARRSDLPFALPDTFWCYDPRAADQAVGALPALANGCVTFGGLNTLAKVNEAVLALWSRVMKATPNSRLRLLVPESAPRERVRSRFAQAGIASERILFAARQPREKYLGLHREIDLGLDTFPYNGHTTSLDSYWMGVPVVTLVGEHPVGRAGLSQLSNLGLTEFAAQTPDEFVRIVSEISLDLPRLAALRTMLRERMRNSPLTDGARFARAIEGVYRTMWERWCSGSETERRPPA